MNNEALKDLLFRMADDALIYAHRNAEWTGLAPTLEEDIAFSSIAQDKFGHAQALFVILESLGEKDADTTAFMRNEKEFRCSHLVEFETMDYAMGLVRHFLFDTAERLRYAMLERSSCEPLAQVALKVKGEIKYHIFHANTWITLLGSQGSTESMARMQQALDVCLPMAYSIFEPSSYEKQLIDEGIFEGELALEQQWETAIRSVVEKAGLRVPEVSDKTLHYGGRRGYHTDELQAMIDEMTEVFRIDPSAQW